MTQKIYDLFISYAEYDQAWVEGYLQDALNQVGVKFFSESSFRLGVPRIKEFQRAIEESHRTLLVISPAYLADDVGEFVELLCQSYGQDTQTWPVIPLILENIKLPPRLSMLVHLSATTPEERVIAINKLCEDLKYSVPGEFQIPSCPYPGMVSFRELEKEQFFGRDEEIEELVERLRSYPLAVVIGASGSGKSSLIYAGLIPYLRKSRLFGEGNWLICTMRPGINPIESLQTILKSDLTDLTATVQNLLSEGNNQRLLLFVDQFEELFTQSVQNNTKFQETLLQLIEEPQCYVILTVRADFYPDLMNSLLWSKIKVNRMEIMPLDKEGLKQAILKPAELTGVFIEPALVEKLINDSAGEPGVLPLLQETLVLLWEKLERRLLPLRAYEALILPTHAYSNAGGDKKNLTGLQVAISRRADAALASLKVSPEKQYNIARRIFIRLVQFGEGRANTRRQQLVSDLKTNSDEPLLFEQTLEHLINSHLLTSNGDETNILKTIDIAHEALITGWPTLQKWINEQRDLELIRRRLIRKAKDWKSLGKKDYGLLNEAELLEAESWLSSTKLANLYYEELISDFIQTSKLEVIKGKRVRQIVMLTISTLGLIAMVSSLFAWQQVLATKENSKEIQRRAIVDEVASQSNNLDTVITSLNIAKKIDENPDLRTQKVTDRIFDNLHETLNHDSQNRNLFAEYNRIFQGNEFIYSLNFDDLGHSIVTTGNNQKILIHNLQEKEKPSPFKFSNQNFKRAIFNRDRSMLLALSENNKVILWDLKTKKREELIHKFLINGKKISNIIFSLDESKIFTVSEDKMLRQWDVKTRKLDKSFNMGYGLSDISINPKDGTIAVGTYNDKVKIFQITNETSEIASLQDLVGHKESVTAVNFSPDGKILASGSSDGIIKLWEKNQDKWQVKVTIPAHNNAVKGIRFSPDSQQIISVSTDKTFAVWDQEGRPLQSLVTDTSLSSVSVFPNQVNQQITDSVKSSIEKIAFPNSWSPRGMGIALWKPRNQIRQILSHEGAEVINSIFIENDKIVSISKDDQGVNYQVKIWQKDSNSNWQENQEFTKNWQNFKNRYCDNNDCTKPWRMNNFIFIPQLNLYVGNINNQIYLWNLQGEETLFPNPDIETEEHNKLVRSISVSSDGKKLVSGSLDNTVKLWDIEQNKLIRTFGNEKQDGHTDIVINVKFSHNDQLIVSTGRDNQAILWDSETGKKIATLSHANKAITNKKIMVTYASFSPDDQTIATASDDGIVKIWDRKGKLKTTFSTSMTTNTEPQSKRWNIPFLTKPPLDNKPHEGAIWGISFTKDGQQVAIAKQNRDLSSRNIRIFDLQGNLLQTLYVGENSVNALSFSDDGKSLVAATGKDGVTVWRYWQVDDLLKYACEWSQDYFKFNADSDEKVKEAKNFCQKLSGGK